MLPAVVDQLLGQGRVDVARIDGLHHGFDFFAEVLVGQGSINTFSASCGKMLTPSEMIMKARRSTK